MSQDKSSLSSSLSIIKQGNNFKEKLGKLTEAVNELKLNVEQEAQADSFDLNSKGYGILNTQIKGLRKAFKILTDVVIEEFDSMKSYILKELQESDIMHTKRIDEVNNMIYKVQNALNDKKDDSDLDLKERIKSIEIKQEEEHDYTQNAIDRFKNDTKILFDKLKIVVNSNTSQVDILNNQIEKLQCQNLDIMNRIANSENLVIDNNNKLCDTDQNMKFLFQDLASKIQENKITYNAFKDNISTNMLKNQNDIILKIQEINHNLNERLDGLEILNKKTLYDFENALNLLHNEFQENFIEFGRIHKESSSQIIVDLENALNGCNNDMKALLKRIMTTENNLLKHREECVTMLISHEKNANDLNNS